MKQNAKSPHLLDEPPIMVYPSLAATVGINKALVLQQLHFLINGQQQAENTHNFIDNRWWVYNSYPEWQRKYFLWLSTSTLKGIFNELENDGLIISMQGVKSKSDRRKWYTIDYEAWDNFCLTIGQKMSDGDRTKNVRSNGQKMSNDSSNNTEKNTDNNTSISAAASASGDVPEKPAEISPVKDKKRHEQDELFEVISLGSFGKDYSALNGQQARVGRIRKELLKLKPDITAAYLRGGYKRYFEKNPEIKQHPENRLKSPEVIIDWCEQAADSQIRKVSDPLANIKKLTSPLTPSQVKAKREARQRERELNNE